MSVERSSADLSLSYFVSIKTCGAGTRNNGQDGVGTRNDEQDEKNEDKIERNLQFSWHEHTGIESTGLGPDSVLRSRGPQLRGTQLNPSCKQPELYSSWT